MADLSEVQSGSILKIEGKVTEICHTYCYLEVNGIQERISNAWVAAAEHIPAPKVFKRGDWVRHLSAQYRGISYKGVVVADGLGILTVSWNHDPMTLLAVAAADLEPDEAPE